MSARAFLCMVWWFKEEVKIRWQWNYDEPCKMTTLKNKRNRSVSSDNMMWKEKKMKWSYCYTIEFDETTHFTFSCCSWKIISFFFISPCVTCIEVFTPNTCKYCVFYDVLQHFHNIRIGFPMLFDWFSSSGELKRDFNFRNSDANIYWKIQLFCIFRGGKSPFVSFS